MERGIYLNKKTFYIKFTAKHFFDMIIDTMKQINLETNVNLYSKTILSDYNLFLIQELYMPIIGSDGVSLYSIFSNRIKRGKKSINFNELTKNITSDLMSVMKHHRYPFALLQEELRRKYNFDDVLYDIIVFSTDIWYNKRIKP